MDINPYESPDASADEPRDGLLHHLPRLGCLFLVAVGGVFFLSLVGGAVFELLFPQDVPKREPHFAPIPVKRSTGQ
ncbi:hypothetical protein NA78x_001126 [Anatilimnocola sp. NA78]|uniref:hypothetical protein n=1 Tax=Anatilimnocola sp. NA78 TaxID=3415683 RepID=UPI003CE5ACF3